MNSKVSDVKRKNGKHNMMMNLSADERFRQTDKRLNTEIQNALLGKDGAKIRRIAKEITSIWIRHVNRE